MVAMLWVTKIIYGTRFYKDVPRNLKGQVTELLVEAGCEHLMVEEA